MTSRPRRQTHEEGRRVHPGVQHPTGQQRPGNEMTSRMGRARSTLGSAQGPLEQKKTSIFKQVDGFSVNTWFLRNYQNTRQETRWFWKWLRKACCMFSGMTPSSVKRAEKSGLVLGAGGKPCPHLSPQPGSHEQVTTRKPSAGNWTGHSEKPWRKR